MMKNRRRDNRCAYGLFFQPATSWTGTDSRTSISDKSKYTRSMKPRYASLFSGAGGLDIGLERAGLDPRGALVSKFYRIVESIRPKMFLFENVRGLVTARDKNGEPSGVVTALIHILEELGYSCRAALYGIHKKGPCQKQGLSHGTSPLQRRQ